MMNINSKFTENYATDVSKIYFVGSTMASLSGAFHLIRDGHVDGNQIHILDSMPFVNEASGSVLNEQRRILIKRSIEFEHYYDNLREVLSEIPSLMNHQHSILEEYNQFHNNNGVAAKWYVTNECGQEYKVGHQIDLCPKIKQDIIQLCLRTENNIQELKIIDVFDNAFFESDFWLYWSSTFAFEKWDGALEFRRSLLRYAHRIGPVDSLSMLEFVKYGQYDVLTIPIISYLKENGVIFEYDTTVNNIKLERKDDTTIAKTMCLNVNEDREDIELSENDWVFVNNGATIETMSYGNHLDAIPKDIPLSPKWNLWRNLAQQDSLCGNPEAFLADEKHRGWCMTAAITTANHEVRTLVKELLGNDGLEGLVTVRDSNWNMNWLVSQADDKSMVIWLYALLSDEPGNFIKKPITECNGKEITEEWLYHLGMHPDKVETLAAFACDCVPTFIPNVTAILKPRKITDRPETVPHNFANLAFIGPYAESKNEASFTVEYSVKTAKEAVHKMLGIYEQDDSTGQDVETLKEALKNNQMFSID